MNIKNFKIFFIVFSLGGFLFSGYMSGVKLFSKTCAFGESCPLFLGMPACYIGFILFASIFVLSIIFAMNKAEEKIISKKILAISFLGVVYSLNFAIPELPLLFKNGMKSYMLGLPTCVLGSIFFIILFIASILLRKKIRN